MQAPPAGFQNLSRIFGGQPVSVHIAVAARLGERKQAGCSMIGGTVDVGSFLSSILAFRQWPILFSNVLLSYYSLATNKDTFLSVQSEVLNKGCIDPSSPPRRDNVTPSI